MSDGSLLRIDVDHAALSLTYDSMSGDGIWIPILHAGDHFYLMTKGGAGPWSGKVTSASLPDWFLFLALLLYPTTDVCWQWRKRGAAMRGFPMMTQASTHQTESAHLRPR